LAQQAHGIKLTVYLTLLDAGRLAQLADSSEICQPFFENAGTRPVRTQHKDNSFHGKRNIAKFTRSTIWGVQ
jgi:hypothetical protein